MLPPDNRAFKCFQSLKVIVKTFNGKQIEIWDIQGEPMRFVRVGNFLLDWLFRKGTTVIWKKTLIGFFPEKVSEGFCWLRNQIRLFES